MKYVGINLRSKTWVISGSYNPNVGIIYNHTVNLSKNIYIFSSRYENFIVIDDFNVEMTNNYLEEFCASYNLKNVVKQPTCLKNPDNPTLIDRPSLKRGFGGCDGLGGLGGFDGFVF